MNLGEQDTKNEKRYEDESTEFIGQLLYPEDYQDVFTTTGEFSTPPTTVITTSDVTTIDTTAPTTTTVIEEVITAKFKPSRTRSNRYRISTLRNYRMGKPVHEYVPRRRIRPGPRYRQSESIPKHFVDAKRMHLEQDGEPLQSPEEIPMTRDMANSGSRLAVDIDEQIFVKTTDTTMVPKVTNFKLEHHEVFKPKGFSQKVTQELQSVGPEEKLFPPKLADDVLRFNPRKRVIDPNQMEDYKAGVSPNWGRMSANRRSDKFSRKIRVKQRSRQRYQPVTLPDDDVILTDKLRKNTKSKPGLTTIDRRPNRPTFHHMGPMQVKSSLQRRIGGVTYGQKKNQYPLSFENILRSDYVRNLIGLNKEDVEVVKDLASNITTSGRELNLWAILDSVNSTVAHNPKSNLAKLFDRFYESYISRNEGEFVEHEANRDNNVIYKKSLSSLIFLSFGIFLLNSVNDFVSDPFTARSFPAKALKQLIEEDFPAAYRRGKITKRPRRSFPNRESFLATRAQPHETFRG